MQLWPPVSSSLLGLRPFVPGGLELCLLHGVDGVVQQVCCWVRRWTTCHEVLLCNHLDSPVHYAVPGLIMNMAHIGVCEQFEVRAALRSAPAQQLELCAFMTLRVCGLAPKWQRLLPCPVILPFHCLVATLNNATAMVQVPCNLAIFISISDARYQTRTSQG